VARPKRIEATLEEPEAERAVLAAVLVDPARAHVLDELHPRAFGRLEHRSVYDAMVRLRQRGEAVDLVTLTAELRALGRLDDVGGMAFLSSLDQDLPGLTALDNYLGILNERRLRRDAKQLLEDGIQALVRNGQPSAEQIRGIREDLLELELDCGQDAFEEWGPLLRTSVNNALDGKLPNGTPTGFLDVDRWLYGGFRPGELVTVAGTTGRGKTVFATQVAWHVAGEIKRPAVYFPYEMGQTEMALRIFASVSGTPFAALRKGQMTERAKQSARTFAEDMADAPLVIAERAGPTPQHVSAICRRVKDTKGLGLVVVDYLQLMKADGKHENRNAEIGAISRSLKQMAMELQVPVLMLSQFNRSHQREKRPPELYDLRESGSIEQDSDIVIALHRESEEASTTDVRVLKHRNGSAGVVQLRWDPACVRFQNLVNEKGSAVA